MHIFLLSREYWTIENIEQYYKISKIALNPVFSGSGTNIKILDYLNHDLPVISTDFGMRGYDDLKAFVKICKLNEFAREINKHGIDDRVELRLPDPEMNPYVALPVMLKYGCKGIRKALNKDEQ